jgi:bifunctional non-homologous end joining protein LigD
MTPGVLLRTRLIEPCLPSPAEKPPSGLGWLHEIKHDGFRLMARRDAAGVRLLTRHGHDWTYRFPLVREAVEALRVRSCLIDGEAIAFEADGLASFELLRGRRRDRQATLVAFDLVELDGRDLRREPLERRKAMLARLLRKPLPGPRAQRHLRGGGRRRVQARLRPRLRGHRVEGLGSRYRSGRSRDWLKFKNPAAPAVRREAEEDWSRTDGADPSGARRLSVPDWRLPAPPALMGDIAHGRYPSLFGLIAHWPAK